MRKTTKRALCYILTIMLMFTFAPAVSAVGGDYQINSDAEKSWTESATITLGADGDTLTLLANSGPTSTVRINVTAPDDSAVTIIGRAGITYENLYIAVTNDNITLNLVDLSIVAPDKTSGVGYGGIEFPNASKATVDVTGSCSLKGGKTSAQASGGAGITGKNGLPRTNFTINGTGTLAVAGTEGYYGGASFSNVNDLTVNAILNVSAGKSANITNIGTAGLFPNGTLTVNAKLSAVGGSSDSQPGGTGIISSAVVMKAIITATGGTGTYGGAGFVGSSNTKDLEINAPIVVRGGEGSTGQGGAGILMNYGRLIINAGVDAVGGNGATSGGYGVYANYSGGSNIKCDVVVNSGTVTVEGGTALTSGPGGHGLVVYNCDLTIDGGDTSIDGGQSTTATGGYGVYLYGNANLTVSGGTLKAYAGEGATSGGTGIFAPEVNGSSINIQDGSVEITGGKGTNNGGNGIYCASLVIDGGQVTAVSGEGAICGSGIHGKSIEINGGTVSASGVRVVPHGVTDFYGGKGINAEDSLTITDGNVTATAGVLAGTHLTTSAEGIYSSGDIVISGAAVIAESSGPSAAIRTNRNLTIENKAAVTATGGDAEGNDAANSDGIAGSHGIFARDGVDIFDSTVYAYGGRGTANNANGGRAIASDAVGGYILISGGTVKALGGDGIQHGGHALFAYYGSIDIGNGANVTAIGGNTTGTAAGNMGGMGIRAFNDGYGETVTIANDAGDVYVRGGMGSATNGQRPSIIGADIYVATGNVGMIAHEADAASTDLMNTPGGDDLYMLTANTSPVAATTISSNVTTSAAGIAPSYTYKAPTLSDGMAYMWLPEGSQTVSASGYNSAKKVVTADNLAQVTLTRSASPGTTYYTIKFDLQGGGAVADKSVASGGTAAKPADPTLEGYTFTGWYTDKECTVPYNFSTKVTKSFTLYAGWEKTETSDLFDDDNGHWAEEYINSLGAQGYVNGVGNRKFAPNNPLTRAQFVQVIYNAFGDGSASSPDVSFNDCDPNAWYAEALNWAYANGIINGYSATAFGPGDNITREQMAVLIIRAAEKFGITFPSVSDYTVFADDNLIGSYAKDAVYAMQITGIIEGKPGGLFDPKGSATRGEMAKVMYFVLDYAGKIDEGYRVS